MSASNNIRTYSHVDWTALFFQCHVKQPTSTHRQSSNKSDKSRQASPSGLCYVHAQAGTETSEGRALT